MQQQGRDNLERQRRHVVGDPGLAATVGRLALNGVWAPDRLHLPKQTPCEAAAFLQVSGNRNCRWASLQDGGYGPLVKILTDPVPAECRYDPATGSNWRYGCPLGVSPSLMVKGGAKSPWMFRLRRCTYPDYNAPSRSCHVAQE